MFEDGSYVVIRKYNRGGGRKSKKELGPYIPGIFDGVPITKKKKSVKFELTEHQKRVNDEISGYMDSWRNHGDRITSVGPLEDKNGVLTRKIKALNTVGANGGSPVTQTFLNF